MKKSLLLIVLSLSFGQIIAQKNSLWQVRDASRVSELTRTRPNNVCNGELYFGLDLDAFKQSLANAADKFSNLPGVTISIPNADGQMESYLVWENSNFEPALQERFPEIRAYVGKGVDDKYATINLSISPLGIQTMVFRAGNGTEYIEPYDKEATTYVLFNSNNRVNGRLPFNCSTHDVALANDISDKITPNTTLANNAKYKTLRLALSCTAEYSNYFGATSSANVNLVLAAMNNTMTRVNGVMEKDLAVHLNIIATDDQVIYYNASTDPYDAALRGSGADSTNGYVATWNGQLMNALHNTLTDDAFDIGHLFGASGGGGNAGCIGCVCDNDMTTDSSGSPSSYKGSGFTSPSDNVPAGDTFDIDYVAHEMGHQLGANHTFTYNYEGSGAQTEPGSGTTIMAYAGVAYDNTGTVSFNVQDHSDALYSYKSITQIQSNLNLSTITCPVTTSLTGINATPTVAGPAASYTIPISTAFVLTGSGSDTDASDVLTYVWEQNDGGTSATTQANSRVFGAKTAGPIFRTFTATASPTRYFPQMSKILAGTIVVTTGSNSNWESCSSIAKSTHFIITARDNHPGMGQTKSASVTLTVDATAGPLTVTSQSTTGISYPSGSVQTVTWNVANTSALAGGSTVDVLLTTNNGSTWTTIASGLTNNGSASVTLPNFAVAQGACRFMVKASANVFLAVNSKNFAIQASLGVQDFALQNLELYPNPNKGNFTIKLNSSVASEEIKVNVYDMRGRMIFENNYSNQATFNENIQLANAQSGVYLVSVSDGNQKIVKRIVIE
ncbi:MAG TPA: M12 family metallo-peptidase [Flavobacterium sp.]|uniref:zinc-dependent metalloprotease n=1 Tax=Flavobacterium sp. TaxID=239 RepID=UPI002CFC5365|nr:zinc-dependent metalloprotease family protein [Flavobacterium sp.]HNP32171.1 M12 family metallo-peptidase [Flavobacterium sp.]